MAAYAHSINFAGQRHDLVKHLTDVAELARAFADKFGAGDSAYLAGTWHDLGKFHPAFQRYLAECEQAPQVSRRGPDHKRAGATVAAQRAPPLAFLVRGHHGGLPEREDLKSWLADGTAREAVRTALELARARLGSSLGPLVAPSWPAWAHDPFQAEFRIRMIFGALVDADCLDTERHFDPESATSRGGALDLAELRRRFTVDQAEVLAASDDSPVNRVRREVYDSCLRAAPAKPGFYRLTVPTGGGKTRSSLAFALDHAITHGLDRVIVAIPYTSIIDQTADVYRQIFRSDRAVLEHHSAVTFREDPADASVTAHASWGRLAAENWDASIVVTTTVQLFESLLGERTSACRKLHNVARSVIVLDEVQTLPPHLLEPLLDVLRTLVEHYQVSVVLCTATQPALDDTPGFRGLPNVREIVLDPARHFAALERVTYEWPCLTEKWDWYRVAQELRDAPSGQAMAVVNTKAEAMALLDALDDPAALHLSTLLCGAHRRVVLAEVRRRLGMGEACLLVSTQVVEAGVDLDFPMVLRGLGPLDRIVQAAGRCNREGMLEGRGRVIIFDPEAAGNVPGAYRIGTDTTRALLRAAKHGLDLHEPAVIGHYFRLFYQGIDLDREKVQEVRRVFNYPEVARRFKLIDDEGAAVVVKFDESHREDPRSLLENLRRHPERSRVMLRRLQPYIVSVRRRVLDRYVGEGLAVEVMPGLWEWFGDYDDVRGLGAGKYDPDQLVVTE